MPDAQTTNGEDLIVQICGITLTKAQAHLPLKERQGLMLHDEAVNCLSVQG